MRDRDVAGVFRWPLPCIAVFGVLPRDLRKKTRTLSGIRSITSANTFLEGGPKVNATTHVPQFASFGTSDELQLAENDIREDMILTL